MNNTNLHIYEKLMDCYNSGDFWDFFDYVSDDIHFSRDKEFKIDGKGTFKTYFDTIGYEMTENNTHSIASLGELITRNKCINYKKKIHQESNDNDTYPDGEIVLLLRTDQFTRPNQIIFLEFNDKGQVNGMYQSYAYQFEYQESKLSNALSIFELNMLAIDEAEKLFKSQGFHVERTEIQVQTLPHLKIYGADEYDFNVFVFADNYPFSGQRNKKVEDYLIFEGVLNDVSTKFVYAQVKGIGNNDSKILPNARYSVDFKQIKEISHLLHITGERND